MGRCRSTKKKVVEPCDPCSPPEPPCASGGPGAEGLAAGPLAWFGRMIQNCYQYASDAKARGRRVVGIMCEYTPRELIMAADAVPVCLCGGSSEMIGPAEEHLPANLCPLIKSTYGYHLRKANPFLEMADLIVAETTCDGKKKMYELMGRTRPMYILELPQKPADSDAMAHWVRELHKLKSELEERFGVQLTDEKIRRAIGTMNRERRFRRQLAELMKSPFPPLTGRQLLGFKSSISGIDADLEQYAKAIEMLKSPRVRSVPVRAYSNERLTTGGSLKGEAFGDGSSNGGHPQPVRQAQGSAALEAATLPVRVLLTGVPIVHGAERVLDIIESCGGLVVCMDNCTGLKPILEDVDEDAEDPILALAQKYFRLPCSVMTRNDRRLQVLRDLTAEYHPQCIIDLIWQACITYDVESYLVRELAEKELGLPYLRIETDYSPSDSARIALRVEALFETVRQQGGEPGCSGQ